MSKNPDEQQQDLFSKGLNVASAAAPSALAPQSPDPAELFLTLAGGETSTGADTLARMEEGLQIFERWTQLLRRAYFIALRRTRPWDWTLSKLPGEDEDVMVAYFCATGYTFIAEVYGIRPIKVGTPEQQPVFGPVDSSGQWVPDSKEIGNGIVELSGWAKAQVGLTRREIYVEATRRSDEPFTGRQIDEDGSIVAAGRGVKALPGDHKSALLSLIKKKLVADAAGIKIVPSQDLETAWADEPGKTLAMCRKGQGFGTAAERTSRANSSVEIVVERALLRDELLTLTGGDKVAAVQVLKEITAWESKDGKRSGCFDHVDRLSKKFQFENAWAKLRQHDHFGPQLSTPADLDARRSELKEGEK